MIEHIRSQGEEDVIAGNRLFKPSTRATPTTVPHVPGARLIRPE